MTMLKCSPTIVHSCLQLAVVSPAASDGVLLATLDLVADFSDQCDSLSRLSLEEEVSK